MKKQGMVKGVVIGIILITLVAGYYYYLSNIKSRKDDSENVKITKVQEVLTRNLENNYPPTPREVVKYFGQLAQCMIGETYTDEEFRQLAVQVQMLYDDELVANKAQEQYLEDLKQDINSLAQEEIVISSYSPASSVDVEEFQEDGFEWARLQCSFTLRKGTQLQGLTEIFLLRKDEAGHWKIYGWKPLEE